MLRCCGCGNDAVDEPAKPEPTEKKVEPAQTPAATMASPKRIFVIYYSTYGHDAKLAQAIAEGINEVEGVRAELYQVAETLSQEILTKMHAAPRDANVPIIDPHKLPEADGFIFGFPTRFGMMCSQFKAMFDATGGLWQSGALVGKPAGLFTSTATQHGGTETTMMTAVTQLAHHGMIYVPIGYSGGSGMFNMSEVQGGAPWGSGTLAGPDGSRQPTPFELGLAKHQGTYTAKIVKKLAA